MTVNGVKREDLFPSSLELWQSIHSGRERDVVRGVEVPFAAPVTDEEAYIIWSAFSSFSPALLKYLFEGRKVSVIDHQNFLAMGGGPLGASFTDGLFVLDRDLLTTPKRADKAELAIWYAVSSLIASDLEDLEEFDAPRFQAKFVRYLRAESSSVDRFTLDFLNTVFGTGNINKTWLRDTYSQKMNLIPPSTAFQPKRHLPMSWRLPTIFRPDFWTQVLERGFTYNLSNDVAMSLGAVNVKERERPESGHDMRVLIFSRELNEAASAFLSVGDWRPAALLSTGMMMTYQTRRPEEEKDVRLFWGTGFDLGVDPESGVILRSYIGIPVFIGQQGVEKESWAPHWEAGVVRLGTNGSFFVGFSISTSVLGTSAPYLGLVARYENF